MPPTISAPNELSPAEASRLFSQELAKLIPFLRAFARSLCGGERETADDLAQEALAKAWKSRDSFAPGTNLKAWLFTILRNEFYSLRRRGWRQQPWDQDAAEQMPDCNNDQMSQSELVDVVRAIRSLSDEQREALVLVAAGGLSYEEAAQICGCEVGTVKSRVSRARKRLLAMMDGQQPVASRNDSDVCDPRADLCAQFDYLILTRRQNYTVEASHGQP